MAIIAIKKNAQVEDLIEQMFKYFEIHKEQAEIIAPLFEMPTPYETGKSVFNVLKKMNYKPDKARQIIQTPKRLLRTLRGDCKSYSIFAASVLACLDYNVRFVYSSNGNLSRPEHVYVQFMNSEGEIITLDATICCYDKEPNYTTKWIGIWMQ